MDSFTLMPSWIRQQITINGIKLIECDYTALHPNIAIKLYQGKESHITHQKVAEWADMELKSVKVEHLSFFNKKWPHMIKSPIFSYYAEKEPELLEHIRKDKMHNGYKITSMRLFQSEVDIMTDVTQYLNSENIQVLYVYDALLCHEKDKKVVIEAMNRIVIEHGVMTSVKTDQPIVGNVLSLPKFYLDEEINLYDVLPAISLTVGESLRVIEDFNRSSVQMKELVAYVNKQNKEQKYKDYDGVVITAERINLLNEMIAA